MYNGYGNSYDTMANYNMYGNYGMSPNDNGNWLSKQVLNVLDVDNDGFVTKQDFKSIGERLGGPGRAMGGMLFKKLDKNRNGILEHSELTDGARSASKSAAFKIAKFIITKIIL